jgi:hypothetical protein
MKINAISTYDIQYPDDKVMLSSVGTGDDAMKDYMLPLLNNGVGKLPQDVAAQRTVPSYIMATASMHNNNGEATVVARVTMCCAWDAIHRLRQGAGARCRIVSDIGPNDINDPIPHNVRVNTIRESYSFVIPAKDKGVYAWIAQNYGLNRPDSWMCGVLEPGGKFMQVAYVDATGAAGKAACLWKSRYYVKSQSWVLGAKESRVAAVKSKPILVADRLPGNDIIYNPCLPTFQCSKPNNTVKMNTSTGDFAKCLTMAESYLNTKLGTYSLSSLDIQHFATHFYGVSSFWYTYRFFSNLKAYTIDSPYNPQLFRQAVKEYCNRSCLKPFPWIRTLKEFEFDHIHKHCFAMAWMITLRLVP